MHQRRSFLQVLFSVLLASIVSTAQAESLIISAAASLTDSLQEIKDAYKHTAQGDEITYNFGGSGTLQRQIENGAPADLFIAAASAPMDALEKQGLLLSNSRSDLLTNTLVLIALKENKVINSFSTLADSRVKHIAIGEPRTVPVGVYAIECLSAQKLTSQVESKLVRLLDVRQVLAAVETGNADAGLVYQTDAASSQKVRIVATAPPGSHQPIVYPIAIVKRSKHPETARKYLDFLKSKTARAIFEKHGFSIAP